MPGPTLRMREGVPATIDVYNETDAIDVVHWHGQIVLRARVAPRDGYAELDHQRALVSRYNTAYRPARQAVPNRL